MKCLRVMSVSCRPIFIRPFEKRYVLWEHLRRTGGRRPQGFRSLSQRFFVRSLSNLVNMLVGIISRPSAITSQIPTCTPKLWPMNCPKLGFTLSKSKSFHPDFTKLGEYFGGHNISTKFYNLPNPARHSWIVALELSKNWFSGISPSGISCPKNVVITIEFTTNLMGVFCVSFWHSCF